MDTLNRLLPRVRRLREAWEHELTSLPLSAEDLINLYLEAADFQGEPVEVLISKDERATFGE